VQELHVLVLPQLQEMPAEELHFPREALQVREGGADPLQAVYGPGTLYEVLLNDEGTSKLREGLEKSTSANGKEVSKFPKDAFDLN